MEITCNRCHQAVPDQSCYCPTCGLPQLVYSSEETEKPAQADRWSEAVLDAGQVEWKHSNAVTLNGRGHQMKNICKRLWQEEEGQDLVEYGLLVVLVALAAIGAMSSLASGVSDAFSKAAANLTTAT
jgi:pilus assembly protein Flp/PilA